MARGNGRQNIVRDAADRDRLAEQLGRAVVRCSWQVFAFVIRSNHLHVVLKTPEPNLARGMQGFLSAYANAWARRDRFSGHVFQGRYRTELVEDETYLWTVTRYVHLNPFSLDRSSTPRRGNSKLSRLIRGSRQNGWRTTTCSPRGPGSSAARARACGCLPAICYRRTVAATGVAVVGGLPWLDLGSQKFVDRIRGMVKEQPRRDRAGNRGGFRDCLSRK